MPNLNKMDLRLTDEELLFSLEPDDLRSVEKKVLRKCGWRLVHWLKDAGFDEGNLDKLHLGDELEDYLRSQGLESWGDEKYEWGSDIND